MSVQQLVVAQGSTLTQNVCPPCKLQLGSFDCLRPFKMDQEYDAVVLGTGLKECIISGLLSVAGMKASTNIRRE